VENTGKYYVHVTILKKHKETNVCNGHRVRMFNVLCLNIKQTAVHVLDAILRLKRNRQFGSTILFLPTCFLLNVKYATI